MRRRGSPGYHAFTAASGSSPWAWTFGVVLEIIVIVLAVLQLGRLEFIRHIVTIVIAGVALWYLTTPRVRAAFGRS
jgi:hypothetical protein